MFQGATRVIRFRKVLAHLRGVSKRVSRAFQRVFKKLEINLEMNLEQPFQKNFRRLQERLKILGFQENFRVFSGRFQGLQYGFQATPGHHNCLETLMK